DYLMHIPGTDKHQKPADLQQTRLLFPSSLRPLRIERPLPRIKWQLQLRGVFRLRSRSNTPPHNSRCGLSNRCSRSNPSHKCNRQCCRLPRNLSHRNLELRKISFVAVPTAKSVSVFRRRSAVQPKNSDKT